MSDGANQQAASAEEVASSMEQMSANIQQNMDNAQKTEKIATDASSEIESGSEIAQQTVDSMNTIANKIGIIGEINCIVQAVTSDWDPVGKREIVYTGAAVTGLGTIVGTLDLFGIIDIKDDEPLNIDIDTQSEKE